MGAIVNMTPEQMVDEMTYRNYAHNRRLSPHITPQRWAKVFTNAAAMEARFQREEAADVAGHN